MAKEGYLRRLSLRNGQKSKGLVMLKRWSVLIIGVVLLANLVYPGTRLSEAFAVKVVKYLFEIKGGPGTPFNQPTDLATGKGGRIYVLDGVYGRVQVFDSKCKFLFLF